jgi:hypothetical protein
MSWFRPIVFVPAPGVAHSVAIVSTWGGVGRDSNRHCGEAYGSNPNAIRLINCSALHVCRGARCLRRLEHPLDGELNIC